MRIELKYQHKSDLGYHRIEILVPNIEREYIDTRLCMYHLCDTEFGLVAIAATDLLKNLEHYQKLIDRNSDLSHVVRGNTKI